MPFAPVVLGPEALEHLTNPGLGLAASPELPVLAAMARLAARERAGTWPAEVRAELTAAVATALASIRAISSAEKQAHLLALLHSVARHAEARAILTEQLAEDGMNTLERIKKSARLEGRAEGKAEGVELGKAQGVALGEVRGKADGLLRLLRRRGFDVGPALEARITSTRDVPQLDRWFDRAIDAATVDAVFGEGQ